MAKNPNMLPLAAWLIILIFVNRVVENPNMLPFNNMVNNPNMLNVNSMVINYVTF